MASSKGSERWQLRHPRRRLEPVIGIGKLKSSQSTKRTSALFYRPRVNGDVVFKIARHSDCSSLSETIDASAGHGSRSRSRSRRQSFGEIYIETLSLRNGCGWHRHGIDKVVARGRAIETIHGAVLPEQSFAASGLRRLEVEISK